MPIVNPTPVTTGVFNGMWITQLRIVFPQGAEKGIIQGQLLPFDGTHLLATGRLPVFIKDLATLQTTDAALAAVLAAVSAKVASLSSNAAPIRLVDVFAGDPAKPVMATVIFVSADNKMPPYRINDCYALAAKDAEFATMFTNTMGKVAQLAGLTVS